MAGQYEEAISIFLKIWRNNPSNLASLKSLRDVCYQRQQENEGRIREMNIFHFAIITILSMLSIKFVEWDLGEPDWRPFAEEDDIMFVRPYMAKREWRSVKPVGKI